jgi:hypothetical protein
LSWVSGNHQDLLPGVDVVVGHEIPWGLVTLKRSSSSAAHPRPPNTLQVGDFFLRVGSVGGVVVEETHDGAAS